MIARLCGAAANYCASQLPAASYQLPASSYQLPATSFQLRQSRAELESGRPSKHLRREGDDLHELPLAQLARHGPEHARANRLTFVVDQDRRIAIEPYVAAILAALLLPAIARSKHASKRVKCVQQLSQLNLALLIYADENEDEAPRRKITPSWVDALRTGEALGFFNATVAWNFTPEFIANNKALLEYAKKRYASLDFPAVTRLCEAFFKVEFTKRLSEIKVPTCIMVGELDRLKGIRYAEILKTNIAHAEYHVFRGAGHASCWERPQEFNSVVLGFLAKQLELL